MRTMNEHVVRKTATNLDDLSETFFAIKKAEDRAPSTLKKYRDNYSYFTEYLDKCGIPRSINEITRDTIRFFSQINEIFSISSFYGLNFTLVYFI
ncbi:hypothetical protein ABE218_13615 [Bacillus smithii]|uniref:hypothetical protein n=1 Tax=Bacillus smithii TaxID=1479 RepID=UPI003D215A69